MNRKNAFSLADLAGLGGGDGGDTRKVSFTTRTSKKLKLLLMPTVFSASPLAHHQEAVTS